MKLYVPALPFGRRGEMYIHETAKVVDIRTISAAHLITDGVSEVAGLNKNVVFEDGAEADVTVFADYDLTVAGTILATTSAAHGFSTGDIIAIVGTSAPNDYNGVYIITVVDADHFYFTNAGWNATTTALAMKGASLTIQQGGTGWYHIDWGMSNSATGANNVVAMDPFLNTTRIIEITDRRKFAGIGDIGSTSRSGLVFLEEDDKITMGIANQTAIQDITIDHFNINIAT